MNRLTVRNGVLLKNGTPFLLRGFGLGGWLLPEGYMWKFYTKCDRPRRIEQLVLDLCGQEYAENFWKRYYSNYITEKDIALIADNGFNSVRLPINSRHLVRENKELNEEYLCYIDDCIRWCTKHEIYVVLDMHGAPGGQTGQNIDDSECDIAELFINPKYQDELVDIWQKLAMRYRDEEFLGVYDLLNEPILKKDAHLDPLLVPLYQRITKAIREVDPEHIVMWEGVHWATNFDIFRDLSQEDLPDNLMLQFHKYWNPPDYNSLEAFIDIGKKLSLPLYCGESGENNLDWYTLTFPLFDRLGISWSFWSYKKMAVPNSISVFPQPERWHELIAYLDGGAMPEKPDEIFDDFIECLQKPEIHYEIFRAIDRRPHLHLPAEAFDAIISEAPDNKSVEFRVGEGASLCFADGHSGVPDYRRYGGESQPESERLLLKLKEKDCVEYRINYQGNADVILIYRGNGKLEARGLENVRIPESGKLFTINIDGLLGLCCISGTVMLDEMEIWPCE